jgi:hypothetical protein
VEELYGVTEEILEREGKKCDRQHHNWELEEYGWR